MAYTTAPVMSPPLEGEPKKPKPGAANLAHRKEAELAKLALNPTPEEGRSKNMSVLDP